MQTWIFFQKYLLSARAGSLVKRISYLSIIGVSVGVSSLVIILSIMSGLNQNIYDKTLSVEPHLVIKAKNSQNELKSLSLNDAQVFPYESQDIIIRSIEGRFQGAVARGMSAESFEQMMIKLKSLQNQLIEKGEHRTTIPFDESELPLKNEVYLGVDLARSLGVFEGDPLYLITPESLLLPPGEVPRYEQVIIKRIIQTNIARIDEQNIFYIQGSALAGFATPASREKGYEVWLNKISNVQKVKSEVSKDSDFFVETWQERNSALFWALKLEKLVIGSFLGLATLIASFSIVSVISLLISQKRQDIAILQVMGMSAQATRSIFIKLGLLLGGVGVLLGVTLGGSISYYIETHPLNILPDIYYDSQIPAKLEMDFLIGVTIVGFVVILLGSLWPARQILNVQPANVLRKKI